MPLIYSLLSSASLSPVSTNQPSTCHYIPNFSFSQTLSFPLEQKFLFSDLERERERESKIDHTMSDIVKEGWNKYLLQLQTHPLRTKALTSGVLIGSSDVIAQKITGAKRLQFRRILLLMLYGIMYSGPFGHFFHKMMDKIFKGKKSNTTVVKKVVLEQLTSSPWNNMLFMMYYGLVVEGRPWGLVSNKVRHDYPSIQLTAWKFWPIVGYINYQYMPIQFRVLFQSFVGSCWAIFLNLRARSVAVKKA